MQHFVRLAVCVALPLGFFLSRLYIYIRLFFLDVAVRWELAVGVIDSNKHFLRQVSAILSGGLSTKVLKPVVIVC